MPDSHAQGEVAVRPAALEVEVVGRLEDLEEDWTRLQECADHPFATWEWNAYWWRRFGTSGQLATLVCRARGGSAAAIVPLCVDRIGPVRVARFLGDGDLRGPVCEAMDRPAVAASIILALERDELAGCRLLLAERLPGAQGWDGLFGGRRLAVHPDPVLPLAGLDWEGFLASRSRNFRQQLRRRERKLVEEHGLRFRLSTDPDRLEADLGALFRLHALRWGGETSGVFLGERGAFHREFAAAAQRHGWLRLWLAEIGDQPVAAWYGWRFAGSEWYYQAGRDPRYDDLSLGLVLLAHTVREACADGVEAYRFLDGAEAYKRRFATKDPGAESLALGRGLAGRLGVLAGATAARIPAVRRRFSPARAKGVYG